MRNEETHILVADLHGGRPVHACHGSSCDGAGDTDGRSPQAPQMEGERDPCAYPRQEMLFKNLPPTPRTNIVQIVGRGADAACCVDG